MEQIIKPCRISGNLHLMLIAGATWAKDPNITALTNTDVINTDFILNISAVIFGVIFSLASSAWLYFLLKQQQKTQGKTHRTFSTQLFTVYRVNSSACSRTTAYLNEITTH